MATYEQPQPAASPAQPSNNLVGGIFLGIMISVAAFAVFTGGFDRCTTLGPQGNKVLICGFRI